MNSILTLSSALVSAVSLVTAEVAPEVTVGQHPMVRGTLHGGHALVFGKIDPSGPLPGGGWGRAERTRLELSRSWPLPRVGCDAVLRSALSGGQPELIDLSGDGGGQWWPTRPGPAPRRWHLAGGVLYQAMCRVDEDTFHNGGKPRTVGWLAGPNGYICRVPLTAPVLAAGRVDPMGEGQDRVDARTVVLNDVKASHWLVMLDPVEDRFGLGWSRPPPPRRPEPELWRTHYDFHPTGPPDRFELYVSSPSGLTRHHSAPRPEIGEGVRRWDEVSAHQPSWVGPFYVVADGDNRHFVVPGGRVFTLTADANPGSALIKTWDGGPRLPGAGNTKPGDYGPVLALVHDSDAGKSYAFTHTHYFHITSKPAPKPHALTAFPGATGEEALDTVAKCGRVIRGLK